MTKQEVLERIQSKLDMIGEYKWYTPLAFVEDMKSLVYHHSDEEAH